MRSKTSKLFAWVIVIILVIGLAGFGIQDVIRSSGTNEVVTFGNQKISSNDYVRMIQQETRSLSQQFGIQLTFSQAQGLGVAQVALQKLISSAILDQTVEDLGFSQSDTILKNSIESNSAFKDIAGRFDPQKYNDILLNVNLQPNDYEDILRKELARNLFLNLTSTTPYVDSNTIELITNYLLEERISDILILTKKDLNDETIGVSSSEIKTFYENSKELFMQPETKIISYVYLSPEKIAKDNTVSNKEIEDEFSKRKDFYDRPETRDIEQIFFDDVKSANLSLKSEATRLLAFEKTLQERGLSKDDVSLGEIILGDLPKSAQLTVFAAPSKAVVGPIETELGFVVYKVNKIFPAINKTLIEVSDEIKTALALEKASNDLNTILNNTNNEIASGYTLEDVANSTEMVFGTLDVFAGAKLPAFASTESFKKVIGLAENYASDVQFNDDGGIFSLRLDKTLEPFIKDFNTVIEIVEQKALEKKILSELELLATDIVDNQKKSGRNLLTIVENWQYESLKDKKFSRFDKFDNLPQDFVKEVFSLGQSESKVVLSADKAYVLQVKSILYKEPESEENSLLKQQISSQFRTDLQQDMINALIDGLKRNHTLYINQKAIDTAIDRFN